MIANVIDIFRLLHADLNGKQFRVGMVSETDTERIYLLLLQHEPLIEFGGLSKRDRRKQIQVRLCRWLRPNTRET